MDGLQTQTPVGPSLDVREPTVFVPLAEDNSPVENSLRPGNECFRMFARASGYGMAMADLSGRLLYGNAAMLRMLDELREEAFAAKSLEEYCSPLDAVRLKNEILPAVREKGQWLGELSLISVCGRTVPCEQSIFLIRDPSESPRMLGIIAADVTHRKAAEERLKDYAAALKTTNLALKESRRLAECASIAKSKFLANMSHELRTPLNAVIGFSDGLLERSHLHPLNEHQKDRLEKIKASGEFLLQLINDILDIAKIEAGRVDAHISVFEIEPLVREAGNMVEALARNKPEVCFLIDVERQLPPMTSDREKILQILFNLLSNAVKFTEFGSIMLRVQKDDGTIRFSVEDTGVGIAPEHLGHMFEQFYQERNEAQRATKGTGLGLAISRAFANLLGGTITVKSVKSQGSVFTLSLPLTLERRKPPETCPS